MNHGAGEGVDRCYWSRYCASYTCLGDCRNMHVDGIVEKKVQCVPAICASVQGVDTLHTKKAICVR